jgi:hypothetical protein
MALSSVLLESETSILKKLSAYTWCFYNCDILDLIYKGNDDITKLGLLIKKCTVLLFSTVVA